MITNNHIFTLEESALAYAKSARRLLGIDVNFLNSNQEVLPIFVSMLFQSLEISIKHVGVESKLFTLREVRTRKHRSGHGIKEIAQLAEKKLGGESFSPIVTAITFENRNQLSKEIIKHMIFEDDMEKTRNVYATRSLGYGQIQNGDFAIINPIKDWVESVEQTTCNLSKAIDLITQWKELGSNSKTFAIWYNEDR